jgi:hypothetical protein
LEEKEEEKEPRDDGGNNPAMSGSLENDARDPPARK